MAASDSRPVPRKNAAYRLYFALRNLSTGALITGWTAPDSEVSLDGAAFADCTNEATEIGSSGCGYIDLTASEMNADSVMYKLTVTNSNAQSLVIAIYPEEDGDYRGQTTSIANNAITANSIAADAITDAKVASDVTIASVTGAVGSVTGAVGSVTGNVGGNVVGSVASVTGAVGSVTGNVGGNVAGSVGSVTGNVGGNVIGNVNGSVASVTAGVTLATDAVNATALATSAVNEITAAIEAEILNDATGGAVIATIANAVAAYFDNAGSDIPPQIIAQAVWTYATRTLTAQSDSSGITTLLSRIIGTLASGTHNPQTGDAYSRLGAPAGASIAADIATKLPTASYTAPPAASAIADAVWDEAISGHATAGSTGAALSAAQSAGDPWSTAIPGAYASGTAGYKLGNLSSGSSSGAAAGEPITRNLNETEPLLFTHAVASAVFTGGSSYKRQYAGATTTPTTLVATPAFLHTVNGQHWYQIPYNASDWPTEAGPIRYELRDTSGNVADFAVYFTDGSTGGGGGADITVEDRSITVE